MHNLTNHGSLSKTNFAHKNCNFYQIYNFWSICIICSIRPSYCFFIILIIVFSHISISCSTEYLTTFSGFSYTEKYFKKKFHSFSCDGIIVRLGTACRTNPSMDFPIGILFLFMGVIVSSEVFCCFFLWINNLVVIHFWF